VWLEGGFYCRIVASVFRLLYIILAILKEI